MTPDSLALIAVFLAVVLLCVKPVGLYITHVMEGRPIWPLRVGARAEGLVYRVCGIDPAAERVGLICAACSTSCARS